MAITYALTHNAADDRDVDVAATLVWAVSGHFRPQKRMFVSLQDMAYWRGVTTDTSVASSPTYGATQQSIWGE